MRTVLVVDDSANNRALMSRMLQTGGHRVIEATNGAEALGLAVTRKPDVVITDVLMPKVDGYELERELRADLRTASIPVVFHTAAYSDREIREMMAASPRLHILPKPAGIDTVLDTVESVAVEDAAGPPGEDGPDREDHLAALNAKLLDSVRDLEAAGRDRRQLLAHLVRAQEDERAAIAGDIHDDSVQAMTAVAMRLELLGRSLEDPVQVERHRELEATVRTAIARLRRLLFQLHPPALERVGLVAALEAYVGHMADTLQCEVQLDDAFDVEPPVPIRIVLYRVAQEALVNVAKHADAEHVTIRATTRDDGHAIEVRDDGRGFVPEEQVNRPGHMGLETMRQRIELAGGRWQLQSEPGAGTTVLAWVPATAIDEFE